VRKGKTTNPKLSPPDSRSFIMKMSELIKKTAENKAAENEKKIQNGYKTVRKILTNDIQEAEMLPGSILKLKVAAVVGDEFDAALKGNLGTDVLKVGRISIYRSTTSRSIINVEGLIPSNIDEAWESLIDELRERI
jgi:hypothetical protein